MWVWVWVSRFLGGVSRACPDWASNGIGIFASAPPKQCFTGAIILTLRDARSLSLCVALMVCREGDTEFFVGGHSWKLRMTRSLDETATSLSPGPRFSSGREGWGMRQPLATGFETLDGKG